MVEFFRQPWMHFFGGPARGSGGSGHIVRSYSRIINSGLLGRDNILVAQHHLSECPENRGHIVSGGMSCTVPAETFDSLEDIARAITPSHAVVMYDGVHFLDDSRTPVFFDELVQSGRRVIVTGVTMRDSCTPYNFAGHVSAMADSHTYRRPVCNSRGCHNRASRTDWSNPRRVARCYSHHDAGSLEKEIGDVINGKIGFFRLYVGCMYAEKSEEMAQEALEVKGKAVTFRCDYSDRGREDDSSLVTFNGTKIPAMMVYCKSRGETAEKIYDVVHDKGLSAVFIDEAFMFPKLPSVIRRLVLEGVQVFASSITTSFENGILPNMAELTAMADEVVDNYAFCNNHLFESCGDIATRNQRLIISSDSVISPAVLGAQVLVAGDCVERSGSEDVPKVSYDATCRRHLTIPGYLRPLFELPPVSGVKIPWWNGQLYLADIADDWRRNSSSGFS